MFWWPNDGDFGDASWVSTASASGCNTGAREGEPSGEEDGDVDESNGSTFASRRDFVHVCQLSVYAMDRLESLLQQIEATPLDHPASLIFYRVYDCIQSNTVRMAHGGPKLGPPMGHGP